MHKSLVEVHLSGVCLVGGLAEVHLATMVQTGARNK
jgi:hypothetical protein